MQTFCTLFDSNYLSRGIAMCESLSRHCEKFVIYVFAFDDAALETLHALALPNVIVVSLTEFEDEELLRVKPARGRTEYCWTCTPSTILHVLEKHGHPVCTYLDADTYFYSSPDVLLAELGDDDVIITEHRYSPQHDLSAVSGIYNVQLVTVRNRERGLATLRWWRQACLESCELNPAEGKCGDQKYLDDWPQRFAGIHVLRHLGGGIAPWNMQQYRFERDGDRVVGVETRSGNRFEVVFAHFHALKITTAGRVQLTGGGYEISRGAVDLLYRPYIRNLDAIGRALRARGVTFDPHGRLAELPLTMRGRLGRAKRWLLRWLRPADETNQNYNNYKISYFLDDLV